MKFCKDSGCLFDDKNHKCYRNKNGILDRHDGPALIFDKLELWLRNGRLHREDGPARITCEGNFWFLYGKQIE